MTNIIAFDQVLKHTERPYLEQSPSRTLYKMGWRKEGDHAINHPAFPQACFYLL